MSDKLRAKVAAVNRVNMIAMLMQPKVAAVFEPFIGQQVMRSDGRILAKIEKLLPEFPNDSGLRLYWNNTAYSLSFNVQACVSTVDSCVYHEISVYVGEVEGGILQKLYLNFEVRHDYTAEEILTKRARFAEVKKLFDEAQSALHPFGEYDR